MTVRLLFADITLLAGAVLAWGHAALSALAFFS
jgi:hypothetical protein